MGGTSNGEEGAKFPSTGKAETLSHVVIYKEEAT